MALDSSRQLGKRFVDAELIAPNQLDLALREQGRTGEPLAEILLNLGFVSRDQVSSVVAEQAGVESVDLNLCEIEPEPLQAVSSSFAHKHTLMPMHLKNKSLAVAMADPLNVVVIDQLRRQTGFRIQPFFAPESEILHALERYYGEKGGPEAVEELLERGALGQGAEQASKEIAETTPVIRLVDQLIAEAAKEGATDIHLEPNEKLVRTRYRVDGILRQGTTIPKNLQPSVTTRLKILADLNISENRLPQDGKIRFPLGDKNIDIRVSTFPGINGENIVLRLLDKERLILGLDHLGFSPSNLAVFKSGINRPNGIILVTGPTGSGKTTTLYSALSHINSLERNIITLEDPVEYELPLIRQSQINLKAGLTFPAGLRAILRQDPDVILVGEIRDGDTMEVAVRAALTGHLVFSTLHTNDAAGAVPRLLDMGLEPYLLASSLVAVIAQRLVRTICSRCRTETEPEEELLRAVGWEPSKTKHMKFYYGKGCRYCHDTGYKGRTGIFEILPVSSAVEDCIVKRAGSRAISEIAKKEGMTTMLEDGLKKVEAGITTLEEVTKVAYTR
ncbi:MAG: GspE/PulE family protein [Candidatus Latescibacterota bacterium]